MVSLPNTPTAAWTDAPRRAQSCPGSPPSSPSPSPQEYIGDITAFSDPGAVHTPVRLDDRALCPGSAPAKLTALPSPPRRRSASDASNRSAPPLPPPAFQTPPPAFQTPQRTPSPSPQPPSPIRRPVSPAYSDANSFCGVDPDPEPAFKGKAFMFLGELFLPTEEWLITTVIEAHGGRIARHSDYLVLPLLTQSVDKRLVAQCIKTWSGLPLVNADWIRMCVMANSILPLPWGDERREQQGFRDPGLELSLIKAFVADLGVSKKPSSFGAAAVLATTQKEQYPPSPDGTALAVDYGSDATEERVETPWSDPRSPPYTPGVATETQARQPDDAGTPDTRSTTPATKSKQPKKLSKKEYRRIRKLLKKGIDPDVPDKASQTSETQVSESALGLTLNADKEDSVSERGEGDLAMTAQVATGDTEARELMADDIEAISAGDQPELEPCGSTEKADLAIGPPSEPATGKTATEGADCSTNGPAAALQEKALVISPANDAVSATLTDDKSADEVPLADDEAADPVGTRMETGGDDSPSEGSGGNPTIAASEMADTVSSEAGDAEKRKTKTRNQMRKAAAKKKKQEALEAKQNLDKLTSGIKATGPKVTKDALAKLALMMANGSLPMTKEPAIAAELSDTEIDDNCICMDGTLKLIMRDFFFPVPKYHQKILDKWLSSAEAWATTADLTISSYEVPHPAWEAMRALVDFTRCELPDHVLDSPLHHSVMDKYLCAIQQRCFGLNVLIGGTMFAQTLEVRYDHELTYAPSLKDTVFSRESVQAHRRFIFPLLFDTSWMAVMVHPEYCRILIYDPCGIYSRMPEDDSETMLCRQNFIKLLTLIAHHCFGPAGPQWTYNLELVSPQFSVSPNVSAVLALMACEMFAFGGSDPYVLNAIELLGELAMSNGKHDAIYNILLDMDLRLHIAACAEWPEDRVKYMLSLVGDIDGVPSRRSISPDDPSRLPPKPPGIAFDVPFCLAPLPPVAIDESALDPHTGMFGRILMRIAWTSATGKLALPAGSLLYLDENGRNPENTAPAP